MIQEVFSGYFGVAWYWLSFEPRCLPDDGSKVPVHFAGSVDYLGDVWLNGQYLGGYEGGEGPFDVDATAAFRPGAPNLLAVRVLDLTDNPIDGYLGLWRLDGCIARRTARVLLGRRVPP
jgi:beta-galactosidase/beta-glucuronidase